MNQGPFNTNHLPPHSYFPPNAPIPGYPPPHPHYAMQQPPVSPSPAAFLSTPDLALITQQGYLAQSQMLAMRQMGLQPGQSQPGATPPQPGMPPQFAGGVPPGGQMTPQMQAQMAHMAQLQQQMQMAGAAAGQGMAGPSQSTPTQSQSHKKKKHRPAPGQQMVPSMGRPMMAPHGQEHYLRNAMAPPPTHHSREPQFTEVPEPWADAVDELDAREMAMGRFRARHELLAEVFGPDPIKNIPLGKGDLWEGLGMDGETLEAKVTALEKENEAFEAAMQERIAEFEKREDFPPSAGITA